MKRCTAAEAVEAFSWWLGYCEKSSARYAAVRDKAVFETDRGSGNYTYAGWLCGLQGQPWCAMMVSTAVCEACGGDKAAARAVLHGIWPYTACDQLYDAAPAAYRGRRGAWTPRAGDVIVFTGDGRTRTHTGMVYAADGTYVYTMEGNTSNMCRKRSYLLSSTYIWGYVRPLYGDGEAPDAAGELYGPACFADPVLHELSKGCAGPEVKTVQRLLYSKGIRGADGEPLAVDGDFGKNTAAAVTEAQTRLGLAADGVVGAATWRALLTGME